MRVIRANKKNQGSNIVLDTCTGPFTRENNRTGWWGGWSPVYTANNGTTTLYDWRSIGSGPVVSPDCITDMTFVADTGNWYYRQRRNRFYSWIDYRIVINGTPVVTLTNHIYRYRDELNDTNPDVIPSIALDIEKFGVIVDGRLNVPASASVDIQGRYRWNVNGSQTSAYARMIGGLRSQTVFTFTPRTIVTGQS